jgi:hypothetical protein
MEVGDPFYPDWFFPKKSGGENLARVKAVFIDFQSFKDFPVAKRHKRQWFADIMAYRYGRLGIQIWETWHTDMGDLAYRYGRLEK